MWGQARTVWSGGNRDSSSKAPPFDAYVLGRPKIDRLVVRILIDENSTLATVLAGGQLHYTHSFTLRFEHLLVLRNQWEPAGKGTAAAVPGTAVFLNLQQRPEYVGDEALLDIRVRRALARSLDRQALNEGLFNGIGFPTETIVPPTAPFYPDFEAAGPTDTRQHRARRLACIRLRGRHPRTRTPVPRGARRSPGWVG